MRFLAFLGGTLPALSRKLRSSLMVADGGKTKVCSGARIGNPLRVSSYAAGASRTRPDRLYLGFTDEFAGDLSLSLPPTQQAANQYQFPNVIGVVIG